MISLGKGAGKEADDRFTDPPWTKSSMPWLAIDVCLPSDHLVRRIDGLVERLNLSELWASYQGRGSRALRPDLLLKMVLYEIQCGKPSPAEWYRDARENDAVKWITLGIRPSRAALYAFRDRIAACSDGWNQQVLGMAQSMGCTVGVRGVLDGTTVAALASRYKVVNQKTLNSRITELQDAIAADEQQQAVEKVPRWMAKHPATRIQQQRRYQAASLRMEELQAENLKRVASDRKKPEKIVVSVSEPEAVVARDKLKVFRPLYNVQLLRDLDSPFITAYDTFPWPSDPGTLKPMLQRSIAFTRRKPEAWLADAAYAGGPDLAVCREYDLTLYAPIRENDFSKRKSRNKKSPQIAKKEFIWLPEEMTYRCPEGHSLLPKSHTSMWRFGDRTTRQTTYRCPPEFCQACPRQSDCTNNPRAGRSISRLEHEDLVEELRQRMETPEAKTLYKLRRQIIELPYADLKEHRSLRHFSGRGLPRARAQVAALVLVYNLLALSRIRESSGIALKYAGIPEKIPS
jgi:transposase